MGYGRVLVGAAALVLFSIGCKTITEELPTRSSSPPPVIVVPIPVPAPNPAPTPGTPSPAPSPTPSPTPNPAPPPTPTPSPTPPPSASSCAPAPAPGNENCPRLDRSDYLGMVESATDDVIRANPSWFRDDGPYKMKLLVEEGMFTQALIQRIRQRGACAGLYAEEVSVRRSREYSENFDRLTASYYLWRGEGSYRSTCVPASTTSE